MRPGPAQCIGVWVLFLILQMKTHLNHFGLGNHFTMRMVFVLVDDGPSHALENLRTKPQKEKKARQ